MNKTEPKIGANISWKLETEGATRQFGTYHGKRLGKALVRETAAGKHHFTTVPMHLITFQSD